MDVSSQDAREINLHDSYNLDNNPDRKLLRGPEKVILVRDYLQNHKLNEDVEKSIYEVLRFYSQAILGHNDFMRGKFPENIPFHVLVIKEIIRDPQKYSISKLDYEFVDALAEIFREILIEVEQRKNYFQIQYSNFKTLLEGITNFGPIKPKKKAEQ